MAQTAKIFMSGRSQAVRLPAEFRFDTKEVFIKKDPITGDIILSKKSNDWSELLTLIAESNATGDVPDDFLSPEDRDQGIQERDPLEGIDL
ncbi:MAG: AbrB/MazE/SpoVT family DNA-binding domain-containing protein [Gilliamella sp.]|nr:AbrB/MazE/SpoVT family DNA-binding domain-containing protein [Gilliamella sp.]